MPIQKTDIDATGGADGYTITANDVTYVIDSGVTVLTTTGIAVTENYNSDMIDNFGQLIASYGEGVAIYGSSLFCTLINEASGTISGSEGVIANGTNAYIANYGTITGSLTGISVFAGSETHVDNYGRISGNNIGIVDEGFNDIFFNHGSISSIGKAVVFSFGSGFGTLNNLGTISGMTASISSSGAGAVEITNRGSLIGDVALTNTGGATVINKGSIDGSVTFGDGTNVFNGHGGTVDGPVTGGSGMDTMTAGADGETLIGGGGADVLTGGAGDDTFGYTAATDSTNKAFDTINGFNFSHDQFDVTGKITKIDTAVSASVSTASFNNDITAALAGGHLAQHSAVLITATAGTMTGDVFLVIDQNGSAGYQHGQDLVIELHGAAGTLTTGDFI